MPQKILIIDDDTRIHSLIKAHFDTQSFEILAATDGTAGMAIAMTQTPDVILLDVDIREKQGFELCRQLKSDRQTRAIPVIFLTGYVDLEARIFGLECGACDYVTKPFNASELQARVRAALRTKIQLDESARHAIYDDLTNMYDRKYFELRLEDGLAVTRRTGRPLGCILVDIDDMELVNTSFSRDVGDDLLKRVGRSILDSCRREDVVCRFEADEFGMLISDTNMKRMAELAERARLDVRRATFIHQGRVVQVTASVGFALARFSAGSSLIGEAQDALRRAQTAGGDCVRAGRELTELRLAV